MARPVIFVTGLTGTQGGAVARLALEKGWGVRGVVRTPDSPAAVALASQGAELVPGDYDDAQALAHAFVGCTAAFIALRPNPADVGAEPRWARSLLTIAKARGVKTVVCSTAVGLGKLEQLDGYTPGTLFAQLILGKRDVDEAVRTAGIDHWTLLHPASFMANFLEPKVAMYAGFRETNTWVSALRPDTQLPLIDERDIAVFAVAAVEDPATFHGQELDLGLEALTASEIMAALSAASGKALKAAYLSEEEIAANMSSPLVAGSLALRSLKSLVDFDKIKEYGIPLSTFTQYLERNKDAVKKTYEQCA
ncbi:NmrA family protein [Niveomyces insectorum RCEF 264]|uniref:NmrA family protein n=1 Tax=Niveomyces insectorum RCEF 264 TaxID=1081102 RepID=A0A167W5L5_9HYPO|nr:NmrA family protein [Niveomyces insectorum RCEF 264]